MNIKNKLIAISGTKGSGKTESAEMLQYCLSVPKWLRQYWIYKVFGKFIHKSWKLLAFADPLKKMLAILLNVPVEKFNDRIFKENTYVNLNTLDYFLLNRKDKSSLSDSKFTKMAKDLDTEILSYNLTIRQLMQYFGTQVMQTYFGRNIWINATLKNAEDTTIITDLRFKAEYEAVKSLGGIVIYVSRPHYTFGQHASEREMEELLNNNKYDYIIENDGSIEDLFENVREICNDL